jgi:hypothetical protein
MRIRFALVAAVAASLVVVGTVTAKDGGRPLSATLTGASEVPGPGDPNAAGAADVRLNQGRHRVCFDIAWADIDGTVFAGHIHVGTATEAGPIVVTLFEGAFAGTDAAAGCVQDVDRALIKDIRKHPADYYVNVHSDPDFPGGAIRGQLGK